MHGKYQWRHDHHRSCISMQHHNGDTAAAEEVGLIIHKQPLYYIKQSTTRTLITHTYPRSTNIDEGPKIPSLPSTLDNTVPIVTTASTLLGRKGERNGFPLSQYASIDSSRWEDILFSRSSPPRCLSSSFDALFNLYFTSGLGIM